MSDLFEQGHACVIGVGGDLPSTVNDALGFAKILKDPERCAYPVDQVKVLTDKDATRAKIITALETLASTTNAESTVLVYFSGHGYQLSGVIESYYLMPHGYDKKALSKTAISGSEFVGLLRDIPAQKLLVLLDCCHAGGLSDLDGFQVAKAPLPPEATKLFAKGGGKMIIGSSMPDELSFAAKPYSVFTYALIKGLCGEGAVRKDGYVRANDLAMYASRIVPSLTSDKQHPVLDIEKADNFILAYYAGGNLQPKSLPNELEQPLEVESEVIQKVNKIANTIVQKGLEHVNINGNATIIITQNSMNKVMADPIIHVKEEYKKNAKKSIQQEYLESLSEDIFEEYKGTVSEEENRWFNLRYDPENKKLSHSEITKNISDRDSEIELIVSRAENKIRLKFSKDMKKDGINIDDLILTNKPIYPSVYKWIWEKKFPRDGWSFLKKSISTSDDKDNIYLTNQTKQRGPNIKKSASHIIKKNTPYTIEIKSQYDGYLLLIDEDENNDKYLFLPSMYFKKIDELTRISSTGTINLYLPDGFSGNRHEHFVAIVTESLINLSRLRHELRKPQICQLNDEDVQIIFQELIKQGHFIAFDKKYEYEKT